MLKEDIQRCIEVLIKKKIEREIKEVERRKKEREIKRLQQERQKEIYREFVRLRKLGFKQKSKALSAQAEAVAQTTIQYSEDELERMYLFY